MSTTVGNGLTVDGTVKASQATQAGEAVVLGDDGLIPASLLPDTGGEKWEEVPWKTTTLVTGDTYRVRTAWGSTEFSYYPLFSPQDIYFAGSYNLALYVRIKNNLIVGTYRKTSSGEYADSNTSSIRLYHLIE